MQKLNYIHKDSNSPQSRGKEKIHNESEMAAQILIYWAQPVRKPIENKEGAPR